MTHERTHSNLDYPMKTVIDTTAHPGGGTMRYFRNVLPRFEGGDEYVVLVPRDRSGRLDLDSDVVDMDHLTVREIPVSTENLILRVLFQQLILPVLLYRWDADVLFSPGDLTAMLAPCPVVLMIHNPNPYHNTLADFTLRNRIKFALLRYLTWASSWKATEIFFVSENSRDAVVDILAIPEDRTGVIYHGVNAKFFDSTRQNNDIDDSQQLLSNKPYILTVSTVLPHKNYETLMRAFDEFSGVVEEDHHLFIAGRQPSTEYLTKLFNLKESLNHGDLVHFLGEVSEEELRRLYRDAKVYVLPSKLETFGMTVLEAMASETPVVAADATSLPEIAGDGAVYFDPEDHQALADVLCKISRNENYRRTLATDGKERVKSFTWDRTASRTDEVLKRAAEPRSDEN